MDELRNLMPHVNAALNALAAVLLAVGLALVKRAAAQPARRAALEIAHKRTMLSAFGVSVVFLVCYLYYHIVLMHGHSTKFPADAGPVRYVYYAILLSHIVLAAAVPLLAIATIYFGLRDRRAPHRRLARWTFPIWMYVSVTGVIVYVMLYHAYKPVAVGVIIDACPTALLWA